MKNISSLSFIAIVGNFLYILWILYNGFEEGFVDFTLVHITAYLGIIILLALNIFLILQLKKKIMYYPVNLSP